MYACMSVRTCTDTKTIETVRMYTCVRIINVKTGEICSIQIQPKQWMLAGLDDTSCYTCGRSLIPMTSRSFSSFSMSRNRWPLKTTPTPHEENLTGMAASDCRHQWSAYSSFASRRAPKIKTAAAILRWMRCHCALIQQVAMQRRVDPGSLRHCIFGNRPGLHQPQCP